MGALMGSQIALVKADNWQGLYVNETLVCEYHEILIQDVMLHVLHKSVDTFQVFEANWGWVDERGDLPENLREVVLENGRTIAENWEQ